MAITRKRYNHKTKEWETETISNAEMKATIMRAMDWDNAQYRKKYDIFKNKLRFYEELQRSRGFDVETQSPVELLYKMSRAKLTYGDSYEPSSEIEAILGVTAHSISKGRRIAKSKTGRSYVNAVTKLVSRRFAGLIEKYDVAKEMAFKILDPIKLEKALSDFAAELHRRYPRVGHELPKPNGEGPNSIGYGETYGSDTNIPDNALNDYDIEQWLN